MTSKPIPINRIDFDQVRLVNDELAAERNTPRLSFPAEKAVLVAGAGEGTAPKPQVPSKESTTHVSVQLPMYLAKSLRTRVATDGVTMRYYRKRARCPTLTAAQAAFFA